MRENRTYGSEGREPGNSTGLPYPYHELPPIPRKCLLFPLRLGVFARGFYRRWLSAAHLRAAIW